MLESWKIITLFVFAKIEIYFSQNMDGIGIISPSAVYSEAGAASRQMILQSSLNSYVRDILIYLTNTAWGDEKLAKGGHVQDT